MCGVKIEIIKKSREHLNTVIRVQGWLVLTDVDLKFDCHINSASAKWSENFHPHCNIGIFSIDSFWSLHIKRIHWLLKLYTPHHRYGALVSQYLKLKLKRSGGGKVSVSNLYLYAWLDSTIRQFHLPGVNFPLDIHSNRERDTREIQPANSHPFLIQCMEIWLPWLCRFNWKVAVLCNCRYYCDLCLTIILILYITPHKILIINTFYELLQTFRTTSSTLRKTWGFREGSRAVLRGLKIREYNSNWILTPWIIL